MQPLLKQFITSFQKAIRAEMAAMRQRLGPFEVPLAPGQALEGGDQERDQLYQFQVLQANDKLVLQAECTLVYEGGEALVTITGIEGDRLTIRSQQYIPLNYHTYTLVIYPWFLYEKLIVSLESLLDSPDFFVQQAMTLFGKGQPRKRAQPLLVEHTALNDSQRRAVQLCSDSSLAFVWGPPGTGKTTTLGHIVAELLSQGYRVLVTSTTNAAVDQALAKLAELDQARGVFERGQIVRLGQTNAETFGASLSQVVKRLNAKQQARLERLRSRLPLLRQQIEHGTQILNKLKTEAQPLQLDLFGQAQSSTLTEPDLRPIFLPLYRQTILALPSEQQSALLARRLERLKTSLALSQEKITRYTKALQHQEAAVVRNARVILATMTNVYLSTLLQAERFNVVIVEEAGMAILPTLFYCASLAKTRVIMVGDPQQLPPIVQSRDAYVYQAMGRNIFQVTVSDPYTSDLVALLDTQYRMHPLIGDLVSHLFYAGKLRHGENTATRQAVAQKRPYPDLPLIVLDTQNQTTCTTREGSFSRLNEKTAQLCLDLALEAIRDGVESVAIITPYVAQSRLIRQHLARLRLERQQVECQTVHRFQGHERDLVIFDTVDAPPLKPGVLLADHSSRSSAQNLVNVSISRARGKLIIVSDVAYFRDHSPGSIIHLMLQQAQRIGRRVPWAGNEHR
jgi:superfamily I DNA and/or RNA helicase